MATKVERQAIRLTMAKLIILALLMFVFAMWVMPPLYTLFCELTGINGKTSGKAYTAVEAKVDTSRVIRVKFVATNNADMPWQFTPDEFSIDVHPGEAVVTHFDAFNPTDQIMVGQAVPSLSPRNAIEYFHKTECFCFNSQTLASHERAELGLQFIVDQDLPKAVTSIILSYSLFDVTAMSADAVTAKSLELEKLEIEEKTFKKQKNQESILSTNQSKIADFFIATTNVKHSTNNIKQ